VQDYYEIQKVLSTTLYGKVLQCVCKKTGQKVALKVSSGQSPYDVRRGRVNCTLEDTKKEQELTQLLCEQGHHPNVVRTIDDATLYNNADKTFLFMEHADGDLWELLFKTGAFPTKNHVRRTAPLPAQDDYTGIGLKEDVARRLFQQILAGVQQIHDIGWAHRDLSLENFLVFDSAADPSVENGDTSNGVARADFRVAVADFGMAVDCNEMLSLTASQTAGCKAEASQLFSLPASKPRPGKVGSMSPEVYNFQSYNPFLCDAFGCGLVLFEMLFGESLFRVPDASCAGYRMLERNGIKAVCKARFPKHPVSEDVIDLLTSLLAIDCKKRCTVADAAGHRWFSGMQPAASVTKGCQKRLFVDVADEGITREHAEPAPKKRRQEEVVTPVELYSGVPKLLLI
jgi:serine/threonine protein kinase